MMDRRTALGTMALAASAPSWVVAGQAPVTKVLLIGKDPDHPPGTHEYMQACELLAKCLRQTPGVTAMVSNGWPKDPALLQDVTVVALYTGNGGTVLFGGDDRPAVEALLAKGVGLACLHWACGSEDVRAGERLLEVLGEWTSLRHTKLVFTTTTIRPTDPEHPVNRGWSAFDLKDEYYITNKFHPDATPIVEAEVEGQQYTLAWTRGRSDGGRSFGCVLGHYHDCFANESFRRLVVNGILWAGKAMIPEAGAPVAIVPADLELPAERRPK